MFAFRYGITAKNTSPGYIGYVATSSMVYYTIGYTFSPLNRLF